MTFTSLIFFIYLPLVLLIFYIFPKKYKYLWLLLASYIFYGSYNVWLLLLLLSITLITYLCGLGINKYQNHKKIFLVISIIATIGSLIIFKYLDFILGNVISILNLFNLNISYSPLNIILPMGISFFTFQSLTYVFDVYKGNIQREKNLLMYALFVTYFPQLVAGPIEKPNDLLPQLKNEHKITFNDISNGLKHIFIGYVLKILVADLLSLYVNNVYGSLLTNSGINIIIATILFGLQIFADFAGYSEIAIGIARLMGVKLTTNFDHPYLAHDISSFWKRWHITLTRFFTDYIYIPLGGNKKGLIITITNTLIVFLLSGLWHGANFTFVIWGLIHGLALCIYRIITHYHKFNKDKLSYKIIGSIITLFIVNFAWIFFRVESIKDIQIIFNQIFTNFIGSSFLLNGFDYIVIGIAIFAILTYSYIPSFINNDLKIYKDKHNLLVSLLYVFLITLLVIAHIYYLNQGGENSFIYFEF